MEGDEVIYGRLIFNAGPKPPKAKISYAIGGVL
jgi:hypothetical protein